MKKLLFSLSLMASAAFAMHATDVTLSVADVDTTSIKGTFVAEKDNTKAHYQPVESFTISGYNFAFAFSDNSISNTQKPALYHLNATPTVRVYISNVITITAPEEMNMASIKMVYAQCKGVDTDNNITCNEGGTVTIESSTSTIVWNRPETEQVINTVTFNLPTTKNTSGTNPNLQIKEFVISDQNTVVEPEPEPVLVSLVKADKIVSGESYALCVEGLVATPIAANKDFGYLYTAEAPVADGKVSVDEANLLKFTEVEGGYNIQFADGRYLYMDEEHNSFQTAKELPADASAVWSVSFNEDGEATITYVANNKFIQYSAQYKSFGCYPEANDDRTLPTLYGSENSVDAIEAVEAAGAELPATYYNLQGVRVDNPANGLYIMVQGKKATKVMVR